MDIGHPIWDNPPNGTRAQQFYSTGLEEMKKIEAFFERYKQARHDVYLADSEQRRILRLHFFTNPEGMEFERDTIGRMLDEKITDSRAIGNRVEITTTGGDATGPRQYVLCKRGDEWRVEKLFLTCPACKGEGKKSCTMCGGTGLWETKE